MKRIKTLFLILSLLLPFSGMAQWKDKGEYSEGLAYVEDVNGKYGFIDKTGKLVIPCKWKDFDPGGFSEGSVTVVDENDEYIVIDREGNVIE